MRGQNWSKYAIFWAYFIYSQLRYAKIFKVCTWKCLYSIKFLTRNLDPVMFWTKNSLLAAQIPENDEKVAKKSIFFVISPIEILFLLIFRLSDDVFLCNFLRSIRFWPWFSNFYIVFWMKNSINPRKSERIWAWAPFSRLYLTIE